MGVKMFEARHNGDIIKLTQYRDEMKGKICCTNCGTPITYVKEHIREVGECDVHVSAYFRLTNNKSDPHSDGCAYITENEIKNIYAECCNEEDLMTKEGETYIVRLHILVDTLEIMVKEEGDTNTEKTIKRSTLRYIKSGDKPAYITTLKRIMKLRCQLDKDGIGEMKEKLKLRFYNNLTKKYDEISWNNFFFEYEKEHYLRAFKYISKKVYHPVAFCGKVKSVEEPTENFDSYKMRIYSVKVETGKYVSLSVLFTNPEIYEEVRGCEGCNVVIYGSESFAKPSEVTKAKDGSDVKYLNISTKIYGANQVLRVESF